MENLDKVKICESIIEEIKTFDKSSTCEVLTQEMHRFDLGNNKYSFLQKLIKENVENRMIYRKSLEDLLKKVINLD